MKPYSIHYKEHENGKTKYQVILAESKEDAYLKFMESKNWTVYSAYVDNVTYQNGNVHYFNTFFGKPY